MSEQQIKVPDIGDFDEVAVIEVLVKIGDAVKAEQSLITVESDKASMEIPSSAAGVVKSLAVGVGDKVKQGSVVLTLEVSGADITAPSDPVPAPAVPTAAAAAPVVVLAPQPYPAGGGSKTAPASTYGGTVDHECDLLVLGAGPGGYSAAFRAADLGLKVILVERYATLGGVCLNVGCIPSKALLHVAAVMDEVKHFAEMGVTFSEPVIDRTQLLARKNKVVAKLTGGLTVMAKMRKVTTVRGTGEFIDAFHVKVQETSPKIRVSSTRPARWNWASIRSGC
jgi:dihydrolipoamide dehydrogenase